MGAGFVGRQSAERDEFTAPFTEFVTEYVWGNLWARPQLDRKTRAMLDLAILGAMGRARGLALHVEAALNTGCTPAEIAEVLLQVAVYAGVSAGADAFSAAKPVIAAHAAAAQT